MISTPSRADQSWERPPPGGGLCSCHCCCLLQASSVNISGQHACGAAGEPLSGNCQSSMGCRSAAVSLNDPISSPSTRWRPAPRLAWRFHSAAAAKPAPARPATPPSNPGKTAHASTSPQTTAAAQPLPPTPPSNRQPQQPTAAAGGSALTAHLWPYSDFTTWQPLGGSQGRRPPHNQAISCFWR